MWRDQVREGGTINDVEPEETSAIQVGRAGAMADEWLAKFQLPGRLMKVSIHKTRSTRWLMPNATRRCMTLL